jgi:hypothetical protein
VLTVDHINDAIETLTSAIAALDTPRTAAPKPSRLRRLSTTSRSQRRLIKDCGNDTLAHLEWAAAALAENRGHLLDLGLTPTITTQVTDPADLALLANHPLADVRAYALAQPTCPPAAFAEAADEFDSLTILEAVLDNPQTPTETLVAAIEWVANHPRNAPPGPLRSRHTYPPAAFTAITDAVCSLLDDPTPATPHDVGNTLRALLTAAQYDQTAVDRIIERAAQPRPDGTAHPLADIIAGLIRAGNPTADRARATLTTPSEALRNAAIEYLAEIGSLDPQAIDVYLTQATDFPSRLSLTAIAPFLTPDQIDSLLDLYPQQRRPRNLEPIAQGARLTVPQARRLLTYLDPGDRLALLQKCENAPTSALALAAAKDKSSRVKDLGLTYCGRHYLPEIWADLTPLGRRDWLKYTNATGITHGLDNLPDGTLRLDYLISIAHNPNTPADVLESLANHDNTRIREIVANRILAAATA